MHKNIDDHISYNVDLNSFKYKEKDSANNLILNNILRGLTMLDNSLDRLMRNNFYDRA